MSQRALQSLILTFRGPLRSWGAASLGDDRWTEVRPTASACLGLVAACAGIGQSDPQLLETWYGSWDVMTASATRWWRDGTVFKPSIREDFQTALDTMDVSGNSRDSAIVSRRGYVENAREAVALTLRHDAPQEFLSIAAEGLMTPVFTPSLGRRCNPFSEPPFSKDGAITTKTHGQVADRLLAQLARPGLMESAVDIEVVEFTCNAGLLTDWASELHKKTGERPSTRRDSLSDLHNGRSGTHRLRNIDHTRVWIPAQHNRSHA